MTTYTYQTIDPPGSTYTIAESINSNGQIVGFYQDSNHVQHGFLDSNGVYTTIDPPDSVETVAVGINSGGQIIGYYWTASGPQLGFLDSKGTYTTIDPPGSATVTPESINKTGQVVGVYRDRNGVDHGFSYSHGAYTTLNYPGALDTYALSINDAGQIVGSYQYVDSNGIGQLTGFLYSHGTYTTISPPTGMTTTPVLFYGRNAAPPFNGPLTISETTPGDVNTASFFDASNNPVTQGGSGFLGGIVKFGYTEIGESTSLSTDYFFLDGKFLGNTSDYTVNQVITDLKNAYTNDIVNGGNNTAQLAIDDAAIEAGRLGVPVSTINESFFDSAGHLVQKSGSFYTYLTSINKSGTIVGHYQTSSSGPEQGFEYSHGTYTPIEFPGAIGTVPLGINDKGQITGYYEIGSSKGITADYSFAHSDGEYTTINPPGSTSPIAFSINIRTGRRILFEQY
jgi:probable HAF family extracellular repeat protein